MGVTEVANGLVTLCKAGKFDEAVATYYGDNIVSVEPMAQEGQSPISTGIEAVKAKAEWWNSTFEVNSATVTGPFVNGDTFNVVFALDVTNRETGKQTHMEETALYKVEGDKIVHETFFM